MSPQKPALPDGGVRVGSVAIRRPEDGLRFIARCRDRGVTVCGAEGFLRTGEAIQPRQEHSCDFEEGDGTARTEAFLRERLDTDLWFEVVTDDPAWV